MLQFWKFGHRIDKITFLVPSVGTHRGQAGRGRGSPSCHPSASKFPVLSPAQHFQEEEAFRLCVSLVSCCLSCDSHKIIKEYDQTSFLGTENKSSGRGHTALIPEL